MFNIKSFWIMHRSVLTHIGAATGGALLMFIIFAQGLSKAVDIHLDNGMDLTCFRTK